MGLKDVFRRRTAAQGATASDDEPGSVSSPLDVGGRGPVTLEDRTRPGGQASPDTNQGKTEPMPSTPGDPDPNAPFEPPSLAEMNVGGADPQAPSHGLALERDAPSATAPVDRVEPGVAPQDDRPTRAGEGVAQRAPGSLGTSPEQQETDVETGAANMTVSGGPASTPGVSAQPGDAKDVSVPHEVPAPGTSEELPVAQGIRAPEV